MLILRNASQLARTAVVGRKAFHAPSAFPSQTVTAKPESMSPQVQPSPQVRTEANEKQAENWSEPLGIVGQRLHVVCDANPNPDYRPYAVPLGAYPVSEPYAQ